MNIRSIAAITCGLMVDIIGTAVLGMVIVVVIGVSLANQGMSESEISNALVGSVFTSPWHEIEVMGGSLISFLAGFVTAKISKKSVYKHAACVATVSCALGFWMGMEYYSVPANILLTVITLCSIMLGAYVWIKKNA